MDVEEIQNLRAEGWSIPKLASHYSVSKQRISKILKRTNPPKELMAQLAEQFPELSQERIRYALVWGAGMAKVFEFEDDAGFILARASQLLRGLDKPSKPPKPLLIKPSGVGYSAILRMRADVLQISLKRLGSQGRVERVSKEVIIPFYGPETFMGVYRVVQPPRFLRPLLREIQEACSSRQIWSEKQLYPVLSEVSCLQNVSTGMGLREDFIAQVEGHLIPVEVKLRDQGTKGLAQLITYMFHRESPWGVLLNFIRGAFQITVVKRE